MQKILLGKKVDILPGRGKLFVTQGHKVLVINHAGVFKAYRNFCPHMGGALRCEGKIIRCSWHGGTFDVETGAAISGPAEGTKLTEEKIAIEGDDVFLLVDDIQKKSLWADDF